MNKRRFEAKISLKNFSKKYDQFLKNHFPKSMELDPEIHFNSYFDKWK